MIDYSVIIRTTGKAGEKYRRLLDSIAALEPRPKEVIVVLPEGFDPPAQRLGWETFYFCPKGMVIQRLYGIAQCKTKYALISDDDIAFEPDFVQKLAAPLESGKYGISAGPLVEFLPAPGLPAIVSLLTGAACPALGNRHRYNTILKTTGYSYNRSPEPGKLYETQSAPWTCFFADVAKLRSIRFEDELWLDKNGYSAHDDTAMFYKAWLRGVTPVIVGDALYQHLDARTSTTHNPRVAYAGGFNTVVFWHRFVYKNCRSLPEKLWARLCFGYHLLASGAFRLLNDLRKHTSDRKNARDGIRAGWAWIKSGEYAALPPVRE